MRVEVTYATKSSGSSMLNPYGSLKLTVVGEVKSIANWIDEHIVAGKAALTGERYVQGESRDSIVAALRTQNYLDLEYGLLRIKRIGRLRKSRRVS